MDFRPMGVDLAGWNFALDKLNHELDRHQFIRELTQNSIEAIQQTPGGAGQVNWDIYPLNLGEQTVNKLCCIDNGVGMTGPELVEYINTGFKSGKQRGHQGNYGIGAKVSALTFNKAGILYMSWKNGIGSMIHLCQAEHTGFYGLTKLERADGTYGWWAPIGDERKPSLINDHGTVVVLLGDSPEQDTFQKPEESPLPGSRWVAVYLQRKYLRLPEGVKVSVREQSDRKTRSVEGQLPLLNKWASSQGVLPLDGFKAHYWILGERALREQHQLQRVTGHVGALYHDELHEARYGSQGGYQRLASFGVIVGQSRVVLYIEPDPAEVETNLTRQHLLVNGEQLPWDKYAAAFSENMPGPIANMMQELLNKADARPNKAKLAERLKELKDMLEKAHRYSPQEDGDERADTPTVGGNPRSLGRDRDTDAPSGTEGGLKSHLYRLIGTAKGEPAKRRKARPKQPEVTWVSHAEGTREQGFLEDRAAYYSPSDNQIVANKDFRQYRKVVKAIHRAVPQANGGAEAAAMLEFEMVLTETVMNLLAMEGSAQWTAEEIRQQFSPESMTNAVNHTFHLVKAAQEEVRQQLKRAQQMAKQEVSDVGKIAS